MKIFFEIIMYTPFVIIGFIIGALAMRIIAKILFRTWFDEKNKSINENEKEK